MAAIGRLTGRKR